VTCLELELDGSERVGACMATYRSGNPHEVHISIRHMHVGAFGVVVGVAFRISNTGRVESYTVEGMMAVKAFINFVRRSGFQNLRVRVAQSGDRAGLAGLIPLSTGRIVGAFVMVLEFRHVIKTINDIWVHPAVIRSNDIHLEFFLPGRLAE
jgi:hypothetical protein